MDKISIIIPVYKVEEYLDRCVDSVVNQTYENIEIILVDDGSTDKCPQMCDSWVKRDNRIKVIHKENGGLSDARNAGIRLAEGDYIGFVDSDDWIAPEMYDRLMQALKRDRSDIACCTVKMVWEDNRQEKLLTVQENTVLDRNEAQENLLKEKKLKQPVWYKLYKRNTIEGIFFEKGRYHEDSFWSYQVIGKANKVSIIDYVGYFYYQRNQSIMGEGYSLRRLDAIDSYCERYEYICKYFPDLRKTAKRSVIAGCIYHAQMADKYLSGDERNYALRYLETICKKYRLKRDEYRSMKATHKIWMWMSSHSLKLTVKIKNALKVGF